MGIGKNQNSNGRHAYKLYNPRGTSILYAIASDATSFYIALSICRMHFPYQSISLVWMHLDCLYWLSICQIWLYVLGTNPSTIFLVIVVTDRHKHRQTHKPTPVKTYSLAFAVRIKTDEPRWCRHFELKKLAVFKPTDTWRTSRCMLCGFPYLVPFMILFQEIIYACIF